MHSSYILSKAPYCARPRGDNLDQVHSDQKDLEAIRQGRLVLFIGGKESQN
jgi:hypothetical protein